MALAAPLVAANQCAKQYGGVTGLRNGQRVQVGEDYINDYWKMNWEYPPVTDAGLSADEMDPDQNFPNGFRRAQLYMDNNPPFCLRVGNTADRMVKVMVEADIDSVLCVVSTEYDELAPGSPAVLEKTCDTHQVSACFQADQSNDVEIMVYCESGCVETETPFLYKVFTSMRRNDIDPDNSAIDTIDMWCMNVDGDNPLQNTWPSELGQGIPDTSAIPDYNPEESAAAAPRGWQTGVFVAGAGAALHMAL